MKGLTLEEFTTLMNRIQSNHAFGTRGTKWVKYAESSYDTRDGTFWKIWFPNNNNLTFSCNHFVNKPVPDGWKYNSLFELINAYFDGEFEPTHDFLIKK